MFTFPVVYSIKMFIRHKRHISGIHAHMYYVYVNVCVCLTTYFIIFIDKNTKEQQAVKQVAVEEVNIFFYWQKGFFFSPISVYGQFSIRQNFLSTEKNRFHFVLLSKYVRVFIVRVNENFSIQWKCVHLPQYVYLRRHFCHFIFFSKFTIWTRLWLNLSAYFPSSVSVSCF